MSEVERRIAHLDMDAFFAAVEQLDDPTLRGRPVVVGGLGPRGVVSTASYEAREFGVGSAMPMTRARRLCPRAAFLKPRFARYKEISEAVRALLREVSSAVEPISLDEAFFDLSAAAPSFEAATRVVAEVKRRVRERTGLCCSVGLAPNRFLAKLASELAKPDGLRVISPDRVRLVLDPLPVGRLWGVGPVTEQRLHGLGIRTVEELRRVPLDLLLREFGQLGGELARRARGEDETPVAVPARSRSISRETTFPTDVKDSERLHAVLRRLANDVARQLQREHLIARSIRIKVRFPDFRTETRQISFGAGVDSPRLLGDVAVELLSRRVDIGDEGVRLVGIAGARLGRSLVRQLSLFEELPPDGAA